MADAAWSPWRRAGWGSCLAIAAALCLLGATGCKPTAAARDMESQGSSSTMARSTAPLAAKPMTNAEVSAAQDGRPVIACFGDSLTAGYGVDQDEAYPARLQTELDRAGYRYRVVNMGISGETTKDALARVDRVVATKPAITVVEFGGNDGLRGLPIESYRSNLEAIVERLQRSGTTVALAGITLPPQFSGPYIQRFNEVFKTVAVKYQVPLYPFLLKDVYGVQGSIQQDGIHPTAQGCRQVAKNVEHFLQPLLKK